jgi:anti-sigma B factor antagonist
MHVRERLSKGVAFIDISGTITCLYPNALKDAVSKLVRRGQKSIVLNLRDVTYVDSAGLGLLVSCYTRATHADATIALANASPRVYELLLVTNVLTIFDLFDSEAEAAASFAAAAA